MSKHSPGPWRWESVHDETEGDDESWRHLRDATGASVFGEAVVVGGIDARLIAAAPELLEMVRRYRAADSGPGAWVSAQLETIAVDADTLIRRIDGG